MYLFERWICLRPPGRVSSPIFQEGGETPCHHSHLQKRGFGYHPGSNEDSGDIERKIPEIAGGLQVDLCIAQTQPPKTNGATRTLQSPIRFGSPNLGQL